MKDMSNISWENRCTCAAPWGGQRREVTGPKGSRWSWSFAYLLQPYQPAETAVEQTVKCKKSCPLSAAFLAPLSEENTSKWSYICYCISSIKANCKMSFLIIFLLDFSGILFGTWRCDANFVFSVGCNHRFWRVVCRWCTFLLHQLMVWKSSPVQT